LRNRRLHRGKTVSVLKGGRGFGFKKEKREQITTPFSCDRLTLSVNTQ